MHEEDEDRDEGQDDQVASVQPLPRRGAQVDRVEAHLHRVGRHEGAGLAVGRGGGGEADLVLQVFPLLLRLPPDCNECRQCFNLLLMLLPREVRGGCVPNLCVNFKHQKKREQGSGLSNYFLTQTRLSPESCITFMTV